MFAYFFMLYNISKVSFPCRNPFKRLHSGENNKYQPEVSDLINEVQKIQNK